jgi:hypothetical protein
MPTQWQIINNNAWPLVCPVGGEHETVHPDLIFTSFSSSNWLVEQHVCKKCGAAFFWRRELSKGALVVEAPKKEAEDDAT